MHLFTHIPVVLNIGNSNGHPFIPAAESVKMIKSLIPKKTPALGVPAKSNVTEISKVCDEEILRKFNKYYIEGALLLQMMLDGVVLDTTIYWIIELPAISNSI